MLATILFVKTYSSNFPYSLYMYILIRKWRVVLQFLSWRSIFFRQIYNLCSEKREESKHDFYICHFNSADISWTLQVLNAFTKSITPWKVISNVTFTASKELFTGNTLTSVISVIRLINNLSSNPDAPENRNSNTIWVNRYQATQNAAFEFCNDHGCYRLRRH